MIRIGFTEDVLDILVSAWDFSSVLLDCFPTDILPISKLRLTGFFRELESPELCVSVDTLVEAGFIVEDEPLFSLLIGFILVTTRLLSVFLLPVVI